MKGGRKKGRKKRTRTSHPQPSAQNSTPARNIVSAAGGAGAGSGAASAACSSVSVSTRRAGRALSLTLNFPFVGLVRAAVGHLFVLTTRLPQQRKRRPSSVIPTPLSPLQLPLHLPVPHLPLPKLHHTPMHDPYRCVHTTTPPSMPTPTPARRTDAALSVSVRGWDGVRGRGRDGGARQGWDRMREKVANRRARVRTNEDRSSVCAWGFTSCFSAWDAEAVEAEGGGVLIPLRVAVGVIRRDHGVTSRSNSR